jgi:hypothetical protein
MSTTRPVPWGRAALLVLAFAVVAFAAVVQENYAPMRRDDKTALVAHRAHSGSDDSAVDATPIDPQPTNADPTVVVAPRFTTAAATSTVEVWLYAQTGAATLTLMGIADVQTATASSLRRESASGDYLTNEPLYFDTAGAAVYDVRYRGVSAGTVEGWAWTVGASSRAAE